MIQQGASRLDRPLGLSPPGDQPRRSGEGVKSRQVFRRQPARLRNTDLFTKCRATVFHCAEGSALDSHRHGSVRTPGPQPARPLPDSGATSRRSTPDARGERRRSRSRRPNPARHLGFAVEGKSRVAVFLGSALALVSTSAIAVLAGETVSRLVAPALLKRLAGASFVLIGAWVLWSSRK